MTAHIGILPAQKNIGNAILFPEIKGVLHVVVTIAQLASSRRIKCAKTAQPTVTLAPQATLASPVLLASEDHIP